MRQRFFFDHIYKAAGSTIDQLFVDQLGQEHCTHCLVEPAISALTRYASKSYITGHFSFSPQDPFDTSRYNFTLLRNPVDRLISHYYFARNDVMTRSGDVAIELAKELNLQEYYDSNAPEILNLTSNFQARHFAALEWDGSEILNSERMISLAKKALHRYDLVGVFHKLGEFVDVIFAESGWGVLTELPRANKTSHRPSLADVPESVVLKLKELNRLDISLYEYASELFDARRRLVFRAFVQKYIDNKIPCSDFSSNQNNDLEVSKTLSNEPKEYGNKQIEIRTVNLLGEISNSNKIFTGENICVHIEMTAHEVIKNFTVGIRIQDAEGKIIYGVNARSLLKAMTIIHPGECWIKFALRNDISYGMYNISVAIHSIDLFPEVIYHWKDRATWFEVIGNMGYYHDGVFKLYPQIETGSVSSGGISQVLSIADSVSSTRKIHLSVYNHSLNGIYARIIPLAVPNMLLVGENVTLECQVINEGIETWPHFGNRPVRISYHWKSIDNKDIIYDGLRTDLASDMPGGTSARLWVNVRAPTVAGSALLCFAVVQEYVGWSKDVTSCLVNIQSNLAQL
jgi:hypothetical protein